jgi:U2 small nuclear ribonucleoprotein A'
MRMTSELLRTAPAYINPMKDRELNIRGFKIPAIENLGVTQDNFDTVDMSNNEIVTVDNFPLLRTLRTILLNNNRVRTIASGLGQYLPRLTTIVLTNNRIATLESLEPLADITTITNLCLLGNPVTQNPQYRLFCIHLFPRLRILDFNKIKPVERKESERIFGKAVERMTAMEDDEDEKTEATQPVSSAGPTEAQKERIKAMIQAATSLEEINRLERLLESGEIPAEVMDTN